MIKIEQLKCVSLEKNKLKLKIELGDEYHSQYYGKAREY
jgi:hypothetical protein